MSAWNRRFETRCSETILAFSWPIVPVSPLARSFRELITKHRSWLFKLYLVGFLTQRRSFEHSTCSQLIFTSRLLQPDVSIPAQPILCAHAFCVSEKYYSRKFGEQAKPYRLKIPRLLLLRRRLLRVGASCTKSPSYPSAWSTDTLPGPASSTTKNPAMSPSSSSAPTPLPSVGESSPMLTLTRTIAMTRSIVSRRAASLDSSPTISKMPPTSSTNVTT